MKFREFNPETDREAIRRIWLEVGWIDKGKEDLFDLFCESQKGWVADVNGSPECFVSSMDGDIRYLDQDIPLAVVSAVTTGRVARKQGLGTRLTAHVVAQQALNGAAVSTLGIFDQGYYNSLGFGNGSYEHIVSLQPSQLKINVKPRVPRRLTIEDAEAVHQSRLQRRRGHGNCNIYPSNMTKVEMKWGSNAFGLGYFDDSSGELTHHVWLYTKKVEAGPYDVEWMAYRDYDQFLELMGLLKGLGDQVNLIKLKEPGGIQLQDLMDKPFLYRSITHKSEFEQRTEALAYHQWRICDMEACLSRTRLAGSPVRFNLELTDPIEKYLDEESPWRGLSGDYIVSLGKTSKAESGRERSLPTLKASVNSFTRLWLGVVSATGLRVTDDLSGPDELIGQLDQILRLPRPSSDWEY